MADAFYVKIDMELYRSRLKWSNGRKPTMEDARASLKALGFLETPLDDIWLGEEVSLRGLNRDEVLAKKRFA